VNVSWSLPGNSSNILNYMILYLLFHDV
jgi:hypothetical protein